MARRRRLVTVFALGSLLAIAPMRARALPLENSPALPNVWERLVSVVYETLGIEMDPDGLGAGMDPNGATSPAQPTSDLGMGMDPNG